MAKLYPGVRAMDWIDGKRDWREFYRLREGLKRGTETHTAMANDPEFAEATAKEIRKSRGGKSAPLSPAGWDDFMHKLADIEDRLIVVSSSFGGGSNVQFTERPKYLAQELAEQMSRKASRTLAAGLLPHENIDIEA